VLPLPRYKARTFSLDDWSHDALKALAKKERVSISVYLRQMIKFASDNRQRQKREQKEIDKLVDHLAQQELAQ
jgi:hypothetical protein